MASDGSPLTEQTSLAFRFQPLCLGDQMRRGGEATQSDGLIDLADQALARPLPVAWPQVVPDQPRDSETGSDERAFTLPFGPHHVARILTGHPAAARGQVFDPTVELDDLWAD